MAFRVADALVRLVVDESALKTAVTSQTGAAATAAESSGTTVGGRFSKAFGAIAVAGAAVAGAAAARSIGKATDFDQQLHVINTVAKVTDEQLRSIGNNILEVSKETGKSTDDLTSGFYDLVSAGVPADKAIAVLRTSAQLATGALGTTGEAVDLLTSGLNAYGLSADQAGRVSDVFAQAVADGKVTVSQLGGTISQIAPLAASAGVSIEEVAAGFAVMTAKGTPAAEAATEMRAAISALLTPNTQLNEIQQRTGKNFAELAKTEGLAKALDELRVATNGDNDAFAKSLGSVEAYQFALSSTGDNAGAFSTELGKINTAADKGGVAMGQYNEVMRSAKSRGDQLLATVKATAIELAGPFVDSLGPVVSTLGPIGQSLAGFGAGLGAVRSAINSGILTSLRAFVFGLGRVALAGLQAIPALFATGGALNFMLGPIGLIVVAVGLLFVAWQTNFLGIRDIVGNVVDWIREHLGGLIDFLGGAATVIGNVVGTIANIVGGVLGFIGDVVGAAGSALDNGLDVVEGKADRMVGRVGGKLEGARDEWYQATEVATSGIGKAIDDAAPGVEAAANRVNEIVRTHIANQKDIDSSAHAVFKTIGQLLRAEGPAARLAAASVASAIASGIRQKRADVDGAMQQLTTDIKNALTPTKERAHDAGLLISKELSRGLKSADPVVKAQAEATRDLIEARLLELGAKTTNIGKDAQTKLRDALHSKDPEIRAQAERTKSILDAGLTKKTTAKTPGDAIGDQLAGDLGSKGGIVGRVAYQLGRTIYYNLRAGVTGTGYVGSTVSAPSGSPTGSTSGSNQYPVAYAEGTPYVPETGLALIHQGEAVLTREEAAIFRAARSVSVPASANLGAAAPPPINFIVEGTSATKDELLAVLERARRYRDFGLFDRGLTRAAEG